MTKMCIECHHGEIDEPAIVRISQPHEWEDGKRQVKYVCGNHLHQICYDFGEENVYILSDYRQ